MAKRPQVRWFAGQMSFFSPADGFTVSNDEPGNRSKRTYKKGEEVTLRRGDICEVPKGMEETFVKSIQNGRCKEWGLSTLTEAFKEANSGADEDSEEDSSASTSDEDSTPDPGEDATEDGAEDEEETEGETEEEEESGQTRTTARRKRSSRRR